ncbi:site-specific integrase [Intestinibaculum porci]|uniref:site-specific integrase n=1 Tax=Intestinibaculum porci TaxID=2487118 RepID=UPI002409C9FE|nr:site-specific integrase [Intestinibaculum porci]MDD6350361.1 site-specific integrase [Intestinibaculum porci]
MLCRQIINEVKELMILQNYSYRTIGDYNKIWNALMSFNADNNIEEFSLESAFDFLEKHYRYNAYTNKMRTSRERRLYRAIIILDTYDKTKTLLPKHMCIHPSCKSLQLLNEQFEDILKDYSVHVDLRCLKHVTSEKYVSFARRLLTHFQSHHVNDISCITIQDCYNYFILRDDLEIRSMQRYLLYTNDFYSFLCDSGMNDNVPKIYLKTANQAVTDKIPSAWSLEELNLLLGAIDRNTPMGKRQYAMIMLAAVTGMRIGDIKKLTVQNFDWKENTVSYTQSKTCIHVCTPLPKNVIDAVLDYLQNGRPKNFECSTVFIRHKEPFTPLSGSDSLYRTIADNIHKANMKINENRHYGFHSLRHTCASILLAEGAPLSTIASILGHSSIDSTTVYLKIDINKLRECILPLSFEEDDGYG